MVRSSTDQHQARPTGGFTLIELLVTLAILAVLATLVVPVAQVQVQRGKEVELRAALREVRGAIDAYKRASDEGRIRREIGRRVTRRHWRSWWKASTTSATPKHRKLFFLRRIPRDPFHGEPAVDDAGTWAKRAYASEASDPQEGDDVYDVYSRSALTGLNGVPLKRW